MGCSANVLRSTVPWLAAIGYQRSESLPIVHHLSTECHQCSRSRRPRRIEYQGSARSKERVIFSKGLTSIYPKASVAQVNRIEGRHGEPQNSNTSLDEYRYYAFRDQEMEPGESVLTEGRKSSGPLAAGNRRQHDLLVRPSDVGPERLIQLPRRPLVDALQRPYGTSYLREVLLNQGVGA